MNKDIMKALGLNKEVANFETGLCISCDEQVKVEQFRDQLSKKEYGISGLCQKCQDSVFGKGK